MFDNHARLIALLVVSKVVCNLTPLTNKALVSIPAR